MQACAGGVLLMWQVCFFTAELSDAFLLDGGGLRGGGEGKSVAASVPSRPAATSPPQLVMPV